MKKTLFLMTHPGSGWKKLVDVLNSDPRIDVSITGLEYHHPDDMDHLTRQPHKTANSAAIWGDVLFHNHQFTCQSFFNHSYFVFLDAGFDASHPEWKSYTDADHYYRLRLSGMSQYFHRAAKSIWNPVPGDLLTFFN